MKIRTSICVLTIVMGSLAVSPALAWEDHPAPAAGKTDAAHGAAAEHAPSVFAGGFGNAILTLIIFGIVVAVLGQKAWPQLLKTLQEREHSIRTALENAKREREEAEKLLAQYKKQIEQARVEATAIVEEGRRDSEAVRRRMQEEARKESDEMIARAKREIQLATDTAIKDLYDKTADLAVNVAGGIIKKELRADDHKALVTESLQRMTASKN